MNYSVAASILLLSLCVSFQPAHSGNEIMEIQPIITTSELVVGTNRFAFGLLKGKKFLNGATVSLKLYAIDGSEASLAAELKVPYYKASNLKQEPAAYWSG